MISLSMNLLCSIEIWTSRACEVIEDNDSGLTAASEDTTDDDEDYKDDEANLGKIIDTFIFYWHSDFE